MGDAAKANFRSHLVGSAGSFLYSLISYAKSFEGYFITVAISLERAVSVSRAEVEKAHRPREVDISAHYMFFSNASLVATSCLRFVN